MKPDPTQTANFYKTDHIDCQYVKSEVCNTQRQLKVNHQQDDFPEEFKHRGAIKTSLCLFEHLDQHDSNGEIFFFFLANDE